ncbi:MAG: glycosyltransferase [Campylobacterota bacterium]|nr:glycosyltransferase [Campylobacterota bacterium]
MKISVIIPTYNRANFLIETIDSVLNQTVKVDEILVIDDGSTDNTKDLLKEIKGINYIYQENKGVSSARNKGVAIAKNRWICFLDSDDIWEDTKIEKQIKFHNLNPDILFSHTGEHWLFNGKTIKQKKHQIKPYGFCFKENIPLTLIGTSTALLHKSIFEDIGLYDENLEVCEDYDLWLRVLYKYELGYIDEKLIKKIAGHQGQLSFTTALMDRYRITALLKHINSDFKEEVIKEIIKKSDILINGAIKHNNKEIEEFYKKLLKEVFI